MDAHPKTYRIRWRDIESYARGFRELDLVRAIEPRGAAADVPLERVRARRPRGRSVSELGPLTAGELVEAGFRVESLTVDRDTLAIVLARDRDQVVLVVSAAPSAKSGPFDVGTLRVSYEHSALSVDAFRAAAVAVRARLAEGGAREAPERFARWLAQSSSVPAAPVRTHRLPDASTLEVRADGKLYLRISDLCQERCVFCFFYDAQSVDNLLRHNDLEDAIGRIDPAGIRQVVLTGGEPTLHPRLQEYVELLAKRGFREIILQTNGIRLAEPGYLEALVPHRDRLGIGFSLHAATEATNDAITTADKGYFPKKLEAIRRSAALGFRTKITLVLSRLNLAELVPFVELCRELTDGSDAFLQLTVPSFEGRMDLFAHTYPRLTELARALPPALRRARALELPVALCHVCQVPPCVVPDDAQHLESMWFCETPDMWAHDRAYGPGCDRCAVRARCSGVWKGYADRFGTGELAPLGPEEVEPFDAPAGEPSR